MLSFIFTQTPFSQILPLDNNAVVSLLTVYPRDKAVYAIFGHTAIRIKSDSLHLDAVYNYGYFDSSQPHFIYKFVKGETDYILGIQRYDHFISDYAIDNARIEEQILNLSGEEKQSIFDFLNNNALPENRKYRYNYFFDNCTTRPRDIIENISGMHIQYPEQKEKTTLRKLVHQCTQPYPWLKFGIDLVIGSGADSIIGARTEMFLPVKLMNAFDSAKISNDSVSYPLVKSRKTILEESEEIIPKKNMFLFSPVTASIILLLIIAGFTYYGFRKNRLYKGIDIILFSVAGIAGCIVSFICFISTHPCTFPNYNIIWLHPLHLIGAILFGINFCRKFTYWYHLINFAVLSVFMTICFILPQDIPGAAIIMASCIWIRSGFNILSELKKRATT